MKGAKPIRSCCILLGFLFMGFGSLSAQTTHYLFFQTENNKPFYLRIMGSTLSSSATGYLLIPKLTNGKYEIHIGFALSNTEQQFELTVEGQDLGFSLKLELDNSWNLFNLADFSQYRGKTVSVTPDPQLKKEEPVITNTVKETEKQADKKETNKADSTIGPVTEKELAKKKIPLPLISKIYDRASLEGIDMIFVVNGTPKSDTVIIYVPAIKPPGIAIKMPKSREIYNSQREQVSTNTIPFTIFHRYKNP